MTETKPTQVHFEIAKNGKTWIWILYAANRRPMCASTQTYKRSADAAAAIQRVQDQAPEAAILIAQLMSDKDPQEQETTHNNTEAKTTDEEPQEVE